MRSLGIMGVLLALVLIQGCVAGYNSALFATRSNLGFDADVGPPANLEIAISRYEGVLEPTFEGGQTVPVIAGMSSGSGALTNFFWGVNSVFATGEAAFAMSQLYGDPTPAQLPTYERVKLSQEPAPTVFGTTVKYVKAGEAKPVVFATDTTLGIKIKWSAQTAQYPSSANIGFKRKEGTFAPIAVRENPNNPPNEKYEADVASLLATLETGVTAPDTKATFNYIQYFATGKAASNLARQKAVRVAMLKRADPGQDIQAAAAETARLQRQANAKPIMQIADSYRAANAQKKTTIMAKAKELTLVSESVNTDTDFLKALGEHSDAPPEITAKLQTLADFAK